MSRIRYAVPMVNQRRSPVCWLACAMMLFQRDGRRTIASSEIDYINGDPRLASIGNIPGGNASIYTYLRNWGFRVRRIRQVHVPMMSHSNRLGERGRNTREPQSMVWHSTDRHVEQTIIHAILQNFGPFILFHRCGRFSYGPNRTTPTTGAHAVLITGVDLDRKICYFNNPWGDVNVPTSLRSIVGAIRDWESRNASPSMAYLV